MNSLSHGWRVATVLGCDSERRGDEEQRGQPRTGLHC